MAGDAVLTVVGNLVADPELRFTQAGVPVVNFRVASTPRRYDKTTGQWVDGDPVFLTCTAWRSLAENVAGSATKGCRVVVVGALRARTYETDAGERRTVIEVEADEVSLSLRFAPARVESRPADGWPKAV